MTPLHSACYHNLPDSCHMLLEAGANVRLTERQYRQNCLHVAVSRGNLECVKVILKHHSGDKLELLQITDKDGWDCFKLVKHPQLLKYLLEFQKEENQ
uniref:Uncharacterized protein n=1 Tax=Arcella intermedia TaxID=1963864 RepID=A0A6B2LV17_9EUKA